MPAAIGTNSAKNTFSRVFTIEGRASPANAPVYEGEAMAGAIDFSLGDITPVFLPSPSQYDAFITTTTIKGAQGLPTLPITYRYAVTLSKQLRIVLGGCPIDVQVHMGKCGNPSDFQQGWLDGKVVIVEGADPTAYNTEDLGTLEAGDRAMVNETLPWVGLRVLEAVAMTATLVAGDAVTDEVVSIAVCDNPSCGTCGAGSNGCSTVFALVAESSGSPGVSAKVVYTTDQFATVGSSFVTTIPIGTDATKLRCVGPYVVVTSEAGESISYIDRDELVEGTGVWASVTTGIVALSGPRKMFSIDDSNTWITGSGGYIYFSANITEGVTPQTDGSVTSEDLLDIHGIDSQNLIAVGNNNAILITRNGGTAWSAVTGPNPGNNLLSCWMKSLSTWLVGDDEGKLWYTVNAGRTWTQKRFSGDGAGEVRAIAFSGDTIGYLGYTTAAGAGVLLRSISGGYEWQALPEDRSLTFPTINAINEIAPCDFNVNLAFIAGLAANGQDGAIVKAA